MINEKEIEHIAGLARLKLSASEKAKFQKELSLILDYVDQLKKLSVAEVPSAVSGRGMVNVMRPDRTRENDNLGQVGEMFEQAPDKKDGFVKVKAILKN